MRRRRTPNTKPDVDVPWADLPERDLLDTRLCDLRLNHRHTWLQDAVDTLHGELQRRGLNLKPHVWLSDEFFSPSNIPGIAIPFYLAHPRLIRIERKLMLNAEGGTWDSCMRILRHEAGHALQHAFQFQRRRAWQKVFGNSSTPYPAHYRPLPRSRNFIQHLDFWYAQSHPDEDFAETFAIWLAPRSMWRKRYATWPALKKLEYVDVLMAELAGQTPTVRNRQQPHRVSTLKLTLREYYDAKWKKHGEEYPDTYDRDLRRLFSDAEEHRKNEAASTFLRRVRADVRRDIARWTGGDEFSLELVMRDMIGRCRALNLRVANEPQQIRRDFTILVTMQTMNYLYRGRTWHPL